MSIEQNKKSCTVTFGLKEYTQKWSEVAQLCPTLCDPMDCGLPGSSIHGIFQARILEWVAISFSRGSSRPRDQTQVSHIGGRRLNLWATREAQRHVSKLKRWKLWIKLWECSQEAWKMNPGNQIIISVGMSKKRRKLSFRRNTWCNEQNCLNVTLGLHWQTRS